MQASSAEYADEQTSPFSIRLSKVSKSFRKATLKRKSYHTLKSALVESFKRKKSQDLNNRIQVIKDLDLEIQLGQAVGIIGRNGSGKSSLLKLITGIYRPDVGSVEVQGKISALIELGAGFHPDFTGRENIYLGGVMYGLSRKQIDERFANIVKYAELEDFIDDPVRTYSSGMYMRLGFSLAVHTNPDILIIDEVLAVGDAHFIHKCQETLAQFRDQKKTMLLVSHDLTSIIKWCDEVLWIDKGEVRKRGNPQAVVDAYLADISREEAGILATENAARVEQLANIHINGSTNIQQMEQAGRWGSREVEIEKVTMLNTQGTESWLLNEGESVTIEVQYRFNQLMEDIVFGIGLIRVDGVCVHGTNTDIEKIKVPLPNLDQPELGNQVYTFRYQLKRLSLLEGSYFLDIAVHKENGSPIDYHHRLYKFSVRSEHARQGVFTPEHEWEFGVIE